MRLARKLFLLAAMALTALAMTATTASAQGVEVLNEETEDHCSAITLHDDHEVEGGCHVEFVNSGGIPLVVQTVGGPVTVSNCEVHLEGKLDENGEGYVTEAVFTPVEPPTNPGCTRAPCDEVDGTLPHHPMIPWRIHLDETEAGQFVEATFCLRTIASLEGGSPTSCEVHIPWTDRGGHAYEIGTRSSHSCENLPPVSIQNVHFVNKTAPESGTEDIEIIHTGV